MGEEKRDLSSEFLNKYFLGTFLERRRADRSLGGAVPPTLDENSRVRDLDLPYGPWYRRI